MRAEISPGRIGGRRTNCCKADQDNEGEGISTKRLHPTSIRHDPGACLQVGPGAGIAIGSH